MRVRTSLAIAAFAALSTSAYADFQFNTVINSVEGDNLFITREISIQQGGHVAAIVNYTNDGEAVVYRPGTTGTQLTLAKVGDNIFDSDYLTNPITPPTFDHDSHDTSNFAFNNLSLSRDTGGVERASFAAFPGVDDGASPSIGVYQYNINTLAGRRILSTGDSLGGADTLQFAGPQVSNVSLQANQEGDVLFAAQVDGPSPATTTIRANTAAHTRILDDSTTYAAAANLDSKKVLTLNQSIFLAYAGGTLANNWTDGTAQIIGSAGPGSEIVRVNTGSIGGGNNITPETILDSTDDMDLFQAHLVNGPTDVQAIVLRRTIGLADDFTILTTFDPSVFTYVSGSLTPTGLHGAFYSLDGSDQLVLNYLSGNVSQAIANIGNVVDGFTIDDMGDGGAPMVNDNGWVVFDATDSSDVHALIGWSPVDHLLHVIAEEGASITLDGTPTDPVFVLPTIFHPTVSVNDGSFLKSSLSEDNYLALSVIIPDDTAEFGFRSVIAETLLELPDPSGVSVALGALSFLALRRRKRA